MGIFQVQFYFWEQKQAYSYECLSKMTINQWYNRFKKGYQSVGNGNLQIATDEVQVEAVRYIFQRSRPITINMIAEDLNLSH